MLERLVEYWLDSVNERGYQAPFCQMLVADEHRLVHSTRHSQIEFGKDVISIAPDGVPCAFQLKGNPGARLTLAQFREVYGQINELIYQRIVYPGIPDVQHRSYLVTNGEIDEEVHRAVDDLNRSLDSRGFGPNQLTLIGRGELLDKAVRLGPDLWPFGIIELDSLLKLLSHRGDDILPASEFHRVLTAIYGLDPDVLKTLSAAELPRKATSAALLVGIALRNFLLRQNHYASVCAWTIYISYTMAVCERYGMNFEAVKQCVSIAKSAIYDSLSALASEVISRGKNYVEGQGLADTEFYHARLALLYALMSIYWQWNQREGLRPDTLDGVEKFLPSEFQPKTLWGEAAVPQLLAHYWYFSQRDPGISSELRLAAILNTILSCQDSGSRSPLAPPYNDIQDVVRHRLHEQLITTNDPLEDQHIRGMSFFCEPLLHLIVRANLKMTCKSLWPAFTMVGCRHFEVEEPWQFCLTRSSRGSDSQRHYPHTYSWLDLQNEAKSTSIVKVPRMFLDEPLLLLLFVIQFPYRATPEVIRFLGRQLSDIWFL